MRRAHQFQQAQESPIQGSGSAQVRSPPGEPVIAPKATGMAYFIQVPMSSTVQGAGSASSGSGSASSSGDMATGSTSASSGSGSLMDLD